MIIHGGEPIGSGTYGCVFRPALRCLNKPKVVYDKPKVVYNEKNKKRSNKTISKLMEKKDALDEYKEIVGIKKKLQTIPNYQDYFLLQNVSYCSPQKLQKEDLIDFNDKCKHTKFREDTVNSTLQDYYILNMPYGGETIKQYFLQINNNQQFISLNNHLLQLLVKGILPMNKKMVFHCDIKENNVLVQINHSIQNLRLIDWGLSTIVKNWNKIPKKWQNRPLQFNSPFSVILFFPSFIEQYNEAIRNTSTKTPRSLASDFLNYLLQKWPGHYETILYFMDIVNGHESGDIKEMILNYLVKVLETFADPETREFDYMRYITEVYIHIVDVYGFLSIFLTVTDILFQKIREGSASSGDKELYAYLQSFLKEYLFEPRAEKYNMAKLIRDIRHMNSFFQTNLSPLLLSSPQIKEHISSFQVKTLNSVPIRLKHSKKRRSRKLKSKFTVKRRRK